MARTYKDDLRIHYVLKSLIFLITVDFHFYSMNFSAFFQNLSIAFCIKILHVWVLIFSIGNIHHIPKNRKQKTLYSYKPCPLLYCKMYLFLHFYQAVTTIFHCTLNFLNFTYILCQVKHLLKHKCIYNKTLYTLLSFYNLKCRHIYKKLRKTNVCI